MLHSFQNEKMMLVQIQKKEDKTRLGRIENTCILLLSSQSLESPDAVFIR